MRPGPRSTRRQRKRTNDYLPVAFGYLEKKMLGAMPDVGTVEPKLVDELEALGCMMPSEGRELLYATIEQVIAPRLKDYGLDALAAWNSRRS